MIEKHILIFIGILLVSLNALSNSDSINESVSDRSENPVSSEGLLLTDESPLTKSSEAEQNNETIDGSTIEINNDLENSPAEETKGFDDFVEEQLEQQEVQQAVEVEQEEVITTSEQNEKEYSGEYKEIQPKINETVIIEPSSAVRLDYSAQKTIIVPYSQRRLKWGQFVGVSVGKVTPEEFSSDFLNDSYDSIYGGDSNLGAEVHMNFKRNFSSYSLGVELNFGYFKKVSDKDLIDSTLEVTFAKLGGVFALDNLFEKEAYIVPYISGGIYQMLYKEEQSAVSNNGTTQISFYASAGLMFDIDWLDPVSAKSAYFESGIENTFIFAEATIFIDSAEESDPNFGSTDLKAGIKVEL
ncbi:MAG: hypothetical protein KDD58_12350 [Bdellovibrionales bacterium]|nr:hypothetical protein [Bdellovibrionales bacterium]